MSHLQITSINSSNSAGACSTGGDSTNTVVSPLNSAIDQFCEEYHLDDDTKPPGDDSIRTLLHKHKLETVQSVIDAIDSGHLDEIPAFKVGYIAELVWALRKMRLEMAPTARIAIATTGNHRPDLSGGTGGAGGDSPSGTPGPGGTGIGPQIGLQDLNRFSVISGGTGGAGGASGPIPHDLQPRTEVGSKTKRMRPSLFGGTGGAGGYGKQAGGHGGPGEGPQIAVEDVDYFSKITGGIGGAGGASENLGGIGGTGDRPKLVHSLLFPDINDDIRRGLKHMKLDAKTEEGYKINSERCQPVLKDLGFQSIGGLFEAFISDLQPSLKAGHVAGLQVVLARFASEAKRRSKSS
ncbi:hypothetical protein K438DRAFT_1835570 [Mycena galopus ATCC 62051]|nr:hypothetical protein K438DRAFT_1835570 [Mycena galopus ATCC 62051]